MAVAPAPERDVLDARLAALAARRAATRPPAGPAVTSPARPAAAPLKSGKRRHPAHGSRIASLGLSVASTGALAAFFAMSNAGTGNQVAAASIVGGPVTATPQTVVQLAVPAATVPAATAPAATVQAAPATAAAPSTVATTTAAPVALPTVVQGGVFHNKWGDVQVQATFGPDGTLVDVVTLQTPSRDGKSVRINDRAAPQLNAAAISVQSANVDTVSGATYTSNDYRRSLQSAIDVAREAGVTTIV